MIVWLLIGESGSYSDYECRVIGAYATPDLAKAAAQASIDAFNKDQIDWRALNPPLPRENRQPFQPCTLGDWSQFTSENERESYITHVSHPSMYADRTYTVVAFQVVT
jgi:hypothetical protein